MGRHVQGKTQARPVSDLPSATGSTQTENEEDDLIADCEAMTAVSANQAMLALPLFAPPLPPVLAPQQLPAAEAFAAAGAEEISPSSKIHLAEASMPRPGEHEQATPTMETTDDAEPLTTGNPETFRNTETGDAGHGESNERGTEDKPIPMLEPSKTADGAKSADGTAAAKQPLPMTMMAEMEVSAEPAVKNLPGTDGAPEIPAVRELPRIEEKREARHDLQVGAAQSQFSATTTFSSGGTTAADVTRPAAEVSAAERVARAVMDGVAQLRHTGTESVSVVLKPDGATELLLRVEMRDGALSAQLHFERGDRGALDQHWDELQKRLAEQGVSLSRGDAGMSGDSPSAQSDRRAPSQEEEAMAPRFHNFTQQPSNNPMTPRKSGRGFETWA